MRLWLVLAGSFWLSFLAIFSFLLVAFSGSGKVGVWLYFANMSLVVLPALCVVAVMMLWVAHFKHWGAAHYWWNTFPLPFILVYAFILLFVWL